MPVRRGHFRSNPRTGQRIYVRPHEFNSDGNGHAAPLEIIRRLRRLQSDGEAIIPAHYTSAAEHLPHRGAPRGWWSGMRDASTRPDDGQPSVVFPEYLSPSPNRRTHRIRYEAGDGTELRMPSRAAFHRFAATGATSVEVPVELRYGQQVAIGSLRFTKDDQGRWQVTGGTGAYVAGSAWRDHAERYATAVVEARRPRVALAQLRSDAGDAQARLAAQTTTVPPAPATNPAVTIARHPVRSSSLRSVGYDPAAQVMTVEFLNSGRVVTYHHVPAAVHGDLVNAASPGRYYNSMIRGNTRFFLSGPSRRPTGPGQHRCPSCGQFRAEGGSHTCTPTLATAPTQGAAPGPATPPASSPRAAPPPGASTGPVPASPAPAAAEPGQPLLLRLGLGADEFAAGDQIATGDQTVTIAHILAPRPAGAARMVDTDGNHHSIDTAATHTVDRPMQRVSTTAGSLRPGDRITGADGLAHPVLEISEGHDGTAGWRLNTRSFSGFLPSAPVEVFRPAGHWHTDETITVTANAVEPGDVVTSDFGDVRTVAEVRGLPGADGRVAYLLESGETWTRPGNRPVSVARARPGSTQPGHCPSCGQFRARDRVHDCAGPAGRQRPLVQSSPAGLVSSTWVPFRDRGIARFNYGAATVRIDNITAGRFNALVNAPHRVDEAVADPASGARIENMTHSELPADGPYRSIGYDAHLGVVGAVSDAGVEQAAGVSYAAWTQLQTGQTTVAELNERRDRHAPHVADHEHYAMRAVQSGRISRVGYSNLSHEARVEFHDGSYQIFAIRAPAFGALLEAPTIDDGYRALGPAVFSWTEPHSDTSHCTVCGQFRGAATDHHCPGPAGATGWTAVRDGSFAAEYDPTRRAGLFTADRDGTATEVVEIGDLDPVAFNQLVASTGDIIRARGQHAAAPQDPPPAPVPVVENGLTVAPPGAYGRTRVYNAESDSPHVPYEALSMPNVSGVRTYVAQHGPVDVPVTAVLNRPDGSRVRVRGHVRVEDRGARRRPRYFAAPTGELENEDPAVSREVADAVAGMLAARQVRSSFAELRRTARGATARLDGSAAASQAAATVGRARFSPESTWSDDNGADRFQAAYDAAKRRREAGEAAVPYMRENATNSLAAARTGRKFGVEIEFDGGDRAAIARDLHAAGLIPNPHQTPYHSHRSPGMWAFETDCTVSGEIISPTLRDSPETWEHLEQVCDIVRRHGGTATARTGGHVHVSCGDYDHSPQNHTRLLRTTKAYEDELYRLANAGQRRGVSWCNPNPAPPPAGYSEIHAARRNAVHGNAVNMAHVSGTTRDHVEFRMWDGSLDPATIQTQVKVSIGITEAALTGRADSDHSQPIGTARRSNGTRQRLQGEAWKQSTRNFRRLLDQIFDRDADKEQAAALFAATAWKS